MPNVVLKILLYIATINYVASGEDDISRQNAGEITEDRWIWGYFNDPVPNTTTTIEDNPIKERLQITTTESTTTTTKASSTFKPLFSTTEPLPSYCLPYNDTRPANPEGTRISTVKCLDYIWELLVRLKKDENTLKCIQYFNKKYKIGAAIGGSPVRPGEYPHMGALGWKAAVGTWVFKCGSSLISEKFVLTAAHCAKASTSDTSIADPVPKIVRLGDKNIIDTKYKFVEPTDVNIAKIIVHPEYKAPKQYFDIALMELERPIKFSKLLQPACLSEATMPGTQATLTGWGVVQTGSLRISPELNAAKVDIIDSKMCDELLKHSRNRNWCSLQEHQLCAGKLTGGVDACQGDSGGPLQVKIPQNKTTQGQMHYVFGVISFGVGCAHPNLPGVYTRVSSFLDWIEGIVWANETK